MDNDTLKPDFTPPAQSELPQGTRQFVDCHKLMVESTTALFAPYLGRHRGISGNYDMVILKLREAGQWAQDAVNMMMNPELFKEEEPVPASQQEKPDGQG